MPSSPSKPANGGAATQKKAGRRSSQLEPDDGDDGNSGGCLSLLLDHPAELSPSEYADLLAEIRADFSSSSSEDEELLHGEWLAAARHNDLDAVRGLLRVHPGLLHHQHASTGNSALHMAAANGHAAVVELLLAVEQQVHQLQQQQRVQQQQQQHDADDNKPQQRPRPQMYLSQLANAAGNTALHWAAANGQSRVVQVMLEHHHHHGGGAAAAAVIDVLQKNNAGRSILTEGFASNDAATLRLLLEHDSASEERLVRATSNTTKTEGGNVAATTTATTAADNETTTTTITDSVTHRFVFRGDDDDHTAAASAAAAPVPPPTEVQIRELALGGGGAAANDDDSGERSSSSSIILGQASSGEQDATGHAIWASSLVAAQWMHDVFAAKKDGEPDGDGDDDDPAGSKSPATTRTIIELGAGCGVPGLVAAAAVAANSSNSNNNSQTTVYLTDFNATTVANLEHNIRLNRETNRALSNNNNNNNSSNVDCRALLMNWQDPSTWPTTTMPNNQPVDVAIGSDLIYQHDMVPLLLQTLRGLRPRRFLYVAPAPASGEGEGERQGHKALLEGLDALFERASTRDAPPAYAANPLESGDDEECFVHFHELAAAAEPFVLYEFRWKKEKGNDRERQQQRS